MTDERVDWTQNKRPAATGGECPRCLHAPPLHEPGCVRLSCRSLDPCACYQCHKPDDPFCRKGCKHAYEHVTSCVRSKYPAEDPEKYGTLSNEALFEAYDGLCADYHRYGVQDNGEYHRGTYLEAGRRIGLVRAELTRRLKSDKRAEVTPKKTEAGRYAVEFTLDGHELMILLDALEHYVPYSMRPASADILGYLRSALKEAGVQFPGKDR